MFAAVRRWAGSLFSGDDQQFSGDDDDRRSVPCRRGHRVLRGGGGSARPPSRRASSDIEADLERLKRKLDKITGSLERELQFSRKTGDQSNRGIVKALSRREERIRSKMRQLATELGTVETGTLASTSMISMPRRLRAVSECEASGNDRSLTQAARQALRKGKFTSASERAIFEKLATDLIEGNPEIHLHVLERLGELKAIAGIPIFSAAARHQSEEIRVAAMHGVLAMRHAATRGILISSLRDPSHRVRVWAVRGLYGLDLPELPELLRDQLDDAHPLVRRAALTYLSWKRVQDAEPAIKACLQDESPEVRAAAARALGQCGGDSSVFKLINRLRDENLEVRKAAAAALERLMGAEIEIDLEAAASERVGAVKDLKASWKTERIARLIGEGADRSSADATDDLSESEGADALDGEEAASDGELEEVEASDAGGELDSETGAGEEASGLSDEVGDGLVDGDAESDGLDAGPDVGGGLDDVSAEIGDT